MDTILLLLLSVTFTASFASFIISFIMVITVILTYKFGINPDNISVMIASSLGDLITFVVMNENTLDVLKFGWFALFAAMLISNCAGIVFHRSIQSFPDITSLQLVVNGAAGNLVGVQISRLSTELHRNAKTGELPCSILEYLIFTRALLGEGKEAQASRILLIIGLCGHSLFISLILVYTSSSMLFLSFIVSYLVAIFLQITLLLYFGQFTVHLLWKFKFDPDNYSIPLLTSFGDLLGTVFLAVAFKIAIQFHGP
ncbi:unnamed protein product [Dracunculus medinensis]|uniref:MgtE domain-containing protein n=1 Tax=Dracunculus medinensis TaxID=318479 RepID=A0A0N4U9F4_DRAME|nr:unnamed protein product [Dracunculus medinensis]